MKAIILFISFAFLVITGFSQKRVPLCHMDRDVTIGHRGSPNAYKSVFDCGFTDNERAYWKIDTLMRLTGMPMNFTICKQEGIRNAYSVMEPDGSRYIVYDEQFLHSLDSDTGRIETITALAHEIGHHLLAHSISMGYEAYTENEEKYCRVGDSSYDKGKCAELRKKYLADSREEELQADRMAGFIMFRYGASLPQITSIYNKIEAVKKEIYDDHPNADKRVAALSAGYEMAKLNKSANISYVDLEKIKQRKIEFEVSDMSVINRNILLEKIKVAIYDASVYVAGNSKGPAISIGGGGDIVNQEKIMQYIGRRDSFFLLDRRSEYFEIVDRFMTVTYNTKIKYRPEIGLHLKDDIFKILIFGGQKVPKVVYTSPFKEDNISLQEIKVIFIEIFRDGMQKEIERFNSTK